MADEIEFVEGLIVKAPRPNAPAFVKASISIKVADLGMWLRAKHKAGDEWVNLDVRESKAGKWYAAVSNFKPKPQEATPEPKAEAPKAKAPRGEDKFADMESDIPF